MQTAINYCNAKTFAVNTKLEDVFTFEHLYESAKKCCRNVRWKTSTQNFEHEMMLNVHKLKKSVLNETFKSKGFHQFTICERGKTREIKSLHITERAVQKCLCDYYLTPVFTPSFIYDNGACLKGKGTGFAIKRLKHHLHKFWQENHTNKGYILLLDIKSFFNSINHQVLIDIVGKKVKDPKILKLFAYLVHCFGGECGLGLGSQISQVSASIYLNKLDHYVKDIKGQKYYGRYMDDAYVISKDKKTLEDLLEGIKVVLGELKLQLSPNKTHILNLSNGFTYLKRKFRLFENGKLNVKPYKPNIRRYCRKYKKLLKKNLSREKLKALEITFKGYLQEFNYIDRYTRRIVYGYFKRTHTWLDF